MSKFNGWIQQCFKPCLSRRTRVTKMLDISHKQLIEIPVEVLEEERTLEILIASSNRITELPRRFFNCDELRELDLSDNEISFIPPAVSSFVHLQKLDLSKNSLKTLPDNMKSCAMLAVFDISINPLEKFPECLTNLTSLTELYMNDVYLDFLPANFGKLINLRILEIRDNNLSKLPKTMNRLINLTRLDIGNNDFDTLPDVVCNLNNLCELWIDCNYLQTLPSGIGNLRKLLHFEASENELEFLPKEIGYWTKMVELSVSSNKLNALPTTIGNMKNLQTLRLDNNKLQCLPIAVGKFTCLEELYLNKNFLSCLPTQIGLLQNLEVLMLDFNELVELPRDICSCKNLKILTLASNSLMCLPFEIGHLNKLTCLNLSENRLQFLPVSLLSLTKLSCLWLSTIQTQPLIPLQQEVVKQQVVLTCFMLPQAGNDEETNPGTPFETQEHPYKERKLKFAPDPYWDNLKQPGKLTRTPTPFPKEARALERHVRRLTREIAEDVSKQDETNVQADVMENIKNTLEIKEAVITTTPHKLKVETQTTTQLQTDSDLSNSGTSENVTMNNSESENSQTNTIDTLIMNNIKMLVPSKISPVKIKKLQNYIIHALNKYKNTNDSKEKICMELSQAIQQFKDEDSHKPNASVTNGSAISLYESLSSSQIPSTRRADNSQYSAHTPSTSDKYKEDYPSPGTYENVSSTDKSRTNSGDFGDSKDKTENAEKKDSLFFIYKSDSYEIKEAKSIKMNLDNASCDTDKLTDSSKQASEDTVDSHNVSKDESEMDDCATKDNVTSANNTSYSESVSAPEINETPANENSDLHPKYQNYPEQSNIENVKYTPPNLQPNLAFKNKISSTSDISYSLANYRKDIDNIYQKDFTNMDNSLHDYDKGSDIKTLKLQCSEMRKPVMRTNSLIYKPSADGEIPMNKENFMKSEDKSLHNNILLNMKNIPNSYNSQVNQRNSLPYSKTMADLTGKNYSLSSLHSKRKIPELKTGDVTGPSVNHGFDLNHANTSYDAHMSAYPAVSDLSRHNSHPSKYPYVEYSLPSQVNENLYNPHTIHSVGTFMPREERYNFMVKTENVNKKTATRTKSVEKLPPYPREPPPYHIAAASLQSSKNFNEIDMKGINDYYSYLDNKMQRHEETKDYTYSQKFFKQEEKKKNDDLYDNMDRPIVFFQDKPQPGQNIIAPTPQRPSTVDVSDKSLHSPVNHFNGMVSDSSMDSHISSPIKRYLNDSVNSIVLESNSDRSVHVSPNENVSEKLQTGRHAHNSSQRFWMFGKHKNCTVKQVTVHKNPMLGFSIYEKEGEDGIFVKNVIAGSNASEVLKPEDKIIEVDGFDFLRINIQEASNILLSQGCYISMMVSRMQ